MRHSCECRAWRIFGLHASTQNSVIETPPPHSAENRFHHFKFCSFDGSIVTLREEAVRAHPGRSERTRWQEVEVDTPPVADRSPLARRCSQPPGGRGDAPGARARRLAAPGGLSAVAWQLPLQTVSFG